MPRYQVQHRYASVDNGQQIGPWEPDDEVDVDTDRAEWINRDSPGTLKPVPAKKTGHQGAPKADRQHRGGQNRGT